MLNLASETDAAWIDQARENIDEILVDHAHCEKKAASTAISLLFRYPEHGVLLQPLSELAREELEHFELVLEILRTRDVAFRRLRPSPYAGRLLEGIRPEEPLRAVDTLLCLALIEARSCERMKLLAENLQEPALRKKCPNFFFALVRDWVQGTKVSPEIFFALTRDWVQGIKSSLNIFFAPTREQNPP